MDMMNKDELLMRLWKHWGVCLCGSYFVRGNRGKRKKYCSRECRNRFNYDLKTIGSFQARRKRNAEDKEEDRA